MIQAAKFGQAEEAAEAIELTDEERVMEGKLRVLQQSLLKGYVHTWCASTMPKQDSHWAL